jgi:hypothetical protein
VKERRVPVEPLLKLLVNQDGLGPGILWILLQWASTKPDSGTPPFPRVLYYGWGGSHSPTEPDSGTPPTSGSVLWVRSFHSPTASLRRSRMYLPFTHIPFTSPFLIFIFSSSTQNCPPSSLKSESVSVNMLGVRLTVWFASGPTDSRDVLGSSILGLDTIAGVT